jgi:DNA repair protein RadD
MKKSPRPYQGAALTALWDWVYNNEGHPVISAAVNSGKSYMIAEFIYQCHVKWPHMKTVMLIDDMKLLRQNMDELQETYPEVNAGFYCASIGQKRLQNDVTIASIQSIHSKAALLDRAPNVIHVDECHKIPHNKQTQYRKFIDDCLQLNPKCKVIGWSGSKYRTDSGHLCKGKDALFSGVAYEVSVKFMIEEGYSVRPVIPPVKTHMDASNVKISKGDYIEKQLQAAVDVDEITKSCVSEIIEVGTAQNRKQWIVYTAGIQHCEHVYEEFKRRGINVAQAHSKIPNQEKIVEDYKSGKIQCLVNVSQYTTGFSHNGIDLMAFMRPTRSPVLYEQMTGRGQRTNYAEGYDLQTRQGRLDAIANSVKPNFAILDFGGVIAELGPIDNITVREKNYRNTLDEDREVEQPKIKPCPKCESPCAPAQRHCYECGYEFVFNVDVNPNADRRSAVMSSDIEPEKLAVIDMVLSKHRKKVPEGSPPATPVMKVTYHTYAGRINEWICFEHYGFPLDQAKIWHDLHMPYLAKCYPLDIDIALEQHEKGSTQYATPAFIWAKKSGKYWNMTGDKDFNKPEPEMALSDEELDEYTNLI